MSSGTSSTSDASGTAIPIGCPLIKGFECISPSNNLPQKHLERQRSLLSECLHGIHSGSDFIGGPASTASSAFSKGTGTGTSSDTDESVDQLLELEEEPATTLAASRHNLQEICSSRPIDCPRLDR